MPTLPTRQWYPEGAALVTPKQLISGLVNPIAAGMDVPQLWHGFPGIGKTAIAKQIADILNARSIPEHHTGLVGQWQSAFVQGSTLDSTDLRVQMLIRDGAMVFDLPPIAKLDRPTVLLVDEVTRNTQSVQNAMLQLFDARRGIGEWRLADCVYRVAACNPETDANSVRLSSATKRRFLHRYVVPSLKDWLDWGEHTAMLAPETMAFHKYYQANPLPCPATSCGSYKRHPSQPGLCDNGHMLPDLFADYSDSNADAAPDPRSWEDVSRLTAIGMPEDDLRPLVTGRIGPVVGSLYMGYLAIHNRVANIPAILRDPTGAPLPADPVECMIVTSTLAARASVENTAAIVTYLDRLPLEYAVSCLEDARRRHTEITAVPAYRDWCVRNKREIV